MQIKIPVRGKNKTQNKKQQKNTMWIIARFHAGLNKCGGVFKKSLCNTVYNEKM